MRSTLPVAALYLAQRALGAPAAAAVSPRAASTIYLCGDSTMAKDGAADGDTDGWGQYLGRYIATNSSSSSTTMAVVNKAVGGRSARSYWDEGRFQAVADLATAGDVVVIEFGHNDGGSPEDGDDGRSDCPGDGEETCVSDATGETVYTFVYYVTQAARLMRARGASVVLSTQTPNNLAETGVFDEERPRFVGYQRTAAEVLGADDPEGVSFVDHFQAVADMYEAMGVAATDALYPNDHTHTSPRGAALSAQAFARAVASRENGTTALTGSVVANARRSSAVGGAAASKRRFRFRLY
ncbi:rhamnogalacturonan acetylesterase [Xylariaceae sp. FL0804]|nr:rhamnogalacturonan acetylesterase [Xylariaceae sp. FL0804]